MPFTGVDNYRRSITLAAALIYKEDLDSYTWALTCFKNLIQRDPYVVITDQDLSMKAAIVKVFPTSRHRLCMWHITEKLPVKVLLYINYEFVKYFLFTCSVWFHEFCVSVSISGMCNV